MTKIIVYHDPKPIPTRDFDYEALTSNYECDLVDGKWRGNEPVGYGATKEEALQELRDAWDKSYPLPTEIDDCTGQ